jgi:hypothetical protein
VLIVWKSGSLNLLKTSGLVQACNGIVLPFYQAVLHTIHAEVSNVGVSFVMMGCIESNWMTQTEQQFEKNSFGNSAAIN